MTIQPPPIDNRSYETIVGQTIDLVERYTTWKKPKASEAVSATIEQLRDRILAEAIQVTLGDKAVTLPIGTYLGIGSPQIASEQDLKAIAEAIRSAKKSASVSVITPSADAGLAMIRIFSRMAKLVSDRINQTPEKNYLAFLDLLGTRIAPPQPARVPLTFTLVENSPEDAFVPAGTQVAAPATETDPEVLFELEEDLVVVRSQLQAAFTRLPQARRYQDHTVAIETDAVFSPFAATAPIPHMLYLACDDILARPGNKTVLVTLTSPQAAQLQQLPITWAYWHHDAKEWETLTALSIDENGASDGLPRQIQPVAAGEEPSEGQWQLRFNLPTLKPHSIDGKVATWLRAQIELETLYQANTDNLEDIEIEAVSIALGGNETVTSGLPDLCFFNSTPLDLSKPFFPFGERPAFNDTFYIASRAAFSQPGATVTLTTDLTSPTGEKPAASDTLQLVWEYWDSATQAWKLLGKSTPSEVAQDSAAEFLRQEPSQAFSVAGSHPITVNLPSTLALHTVNGETNYWLRVRIAGGDYGEPAKSVKVGKTDSGQPIYDLEPESFIPPLIQSLQLSYTLPEASSASTAVRLKNNFRYYPYQTGSTFRLFPPPQESDPALYLKFDRLFPNRPVTLFVDVESPEPGQLMGQTTRLRDAIAAGETQLPVESTYGFRPGQFIRLAPGSEFQADGKIIDITPDRVLTLENPAAESSVTAPLIQDYPRHTRIERVVPRPQLAWEYHTVAGWVSLGALDETQRFTDRGLIRFIGPTNWTAHQDFEQHGYWLRVRWADGDFVVPPKLRQIWPNTLWASALVTLKDEVLGSGTGDPYQRVVANRAPVLRGQRLLIQEQLSPVEKAQLVAEGQYAILPATAIAKEAPADWIEWQEVIDFYGSGPHDRHYQLNRLTGEIDFGDGFQGHVPPLGQQNIRFSYRVGGGPHGNRPAHAIQQLKTTVPYVDRVTNPVAASGAASEESLAQVKVRGPKQLRHRGRAVTAQDLEDLAFEASAQVARARAMPPTVLTADQSATAQRSQRAEPALDLDWLPVFHLPITTQWLTLTLTWEGLDTVTDLAGNEQPAALQARVYGPGQARAWVEQDIPKTPAIPGPQAESAVNLPRLLSLTPSGLANQSWRLVLSNPHAADATDLVGTLTYDTTAVETANETNTESITLEIKRLSQFPNRRASFQAGRVDVVIVPHSTARQPTPSLGLIERVETYLSQRCSPTMALQVTEPQWVEVTVSATLVPTSFQQADTVRRLAVAALDQFLHPLTGGLQRQGWPFDRRPHQSDIYAVLGKVPGVDHITHLSLSLDPQAPLPDRFLIFSGRHMIHLHLS